MTQINPVCNHYKDFEILLPQVADVPGVIFEFGVYNGGSTRQLHAYGRKIWAFDTYEGIPHEDFDQDLGDHDEPEKFKAIDTPEVLFKDYPNVVPVKGRFVDTLPTIHRDLRAAFVYMDCDLYNSYQQVLEWLPDHLSPGAIVLIDDYNACQGCKRAVDPWMQKHKLKWGVDNKHYFIWP